MDSRLSHDDAYTFAMLCAQVRLAASMPGAHPVLKFALMGLDELREKVSPPESLRSLEELREDLPDNLVN